MSGRVCVLCSIVTLLLSPMWGCDESEEEPLLPAPMDGVTFIVAEEFDPYPAVEAQLPVLARYPEVALCLAIRPHQFPGEQLASLLKAAARQQVPVIGWLLLTEEDGYWFSEETIPQARQVVSAFVDWVEAEKLPLLWLMFDMEMVLRKVRQMEGGDLTNVVIPLLKENLDPQTYQQSTSAYAQLVSDLQARGYRVTAAAYPYVLDDLLDGDNDIQDAFNTPIVDVPFDEIYFMAYRTTYQTLLGMMPGPELVYQYAREAKEKFGSAGIIALGTIAGIGMVSDAGFAKPTELAPDIAAVRAGGNQRVFVFSLDGMLATGELESWLALADTAPEKPESDEVTQQVRTIFSLADRLLEQ